MKLQCFGLSPTNLCFLVKFGNIRILLDCGLELTSLLHFDPNYSYSTFNKNSQSKTTNITQKHGDYNLINARIKFVPPNLDMVDWSEVDLILISNYHNMLALPYITEYTSFKGKIYATEPTIQVGKQFMDELVYYETKSTINDNPSWQQKDQLTQFGDITRWRSLYTKHDVESSISKILSLSFQENVNIYSLLTITPYSSGYCLGSANWVIKTAREKIVYMADSALSANRHPEPMNIEFLRQSDVLIATKLTPEPLFSPEAVVPEFCHLIGQTLVNGGNVLIPAYPSGVVLDLIEVVAQFLTNAGGLNHVPIYIVSPSAEYIFTYCNIVSEWLCKAKQEKTYLPEPPFPFEDLINTSKLFHFADMTLASDGIAAPTFVGNNANGCNTNKFKEPAIVFAGHPSLRFGPILHFLKLWANNPKNTLLFIESDFDYNAAIAPFQFPATNNNNNEKSEFNMRVYYRPIDPRMNFADCNNLIRELKPKHLVIPRVYSQATSGNISNPRRVILPISGEENTTLLSHLDIANIPFEKHYEKASMAQHLAMAVRPEKIIGGNTAIVSVYATLDRRDNLFTLEVPKYDHRMHKRAHPKFIWGDSPQVELLTKALREEGIAQCEVEKDDANMTTTIYLPTLKASIKLKADETNISTADTSTHQLLKGIILSVLSDA